MSKDPSPGLLGDYSPTRRSFSIPLPRMYIPPPLSSHSSPSNASDNKCTGHIHARRSDVAPHSASATTGFKAQPASPRLFSVVLLRRTNAPRSFSAPPSEDALPPKSVPANEPRPRTVIGQAFQIPPSVPHATGYGARRVARAATA